MRHHVPGPPADSAERAFITSRLVAAPPEKVFDAFRDPSRLARWWGPDGFTNTFHEFDFRTGGAWRFVMHGPDGTDYPNHHVFAEVAAPERVVFEHLGAHHFHMTITFTAHGDDTLVGWRQVFDTAAERESIAGVVIPANEQNLDRLTAEVLGAG